MSEIIKIDDYKDTIELVIQQFKDKPNFRAILEIIGDEMNMLEDAFFEIRDNYTILTAEGVQLDNIGKIQQISRNGLNDDDYRLAIYTKIIINNGSGERETIITFFTELLGATICRLYELGNGILGIYTDVTITQAIFNQILEILAAGVGLQITFGGAPPFGFAGNPDVAGFGASGLSGGGQLAAGLNT